MTKHEVKKKVLKWIPGQHKKVEDKLEITKVEGKSIVRRIYEMLKNGGGGLEKTEEEEEENRY